MCIRDRLSTGHNSLLGPHTTTIFLLPLFHWRFLCPVVFLGCLPPFLLHQTIWLQLCLFGLNLAYLNFLLRRRQLHYYTNLLHTCEYLIQLDKKKTNKHINAIIQAFIQNALGFEGWSRITVLLSQSGEVLHRNDKQFFKFNASVVSHCLSRCFTAAFTIRLFPISSFSRLRPYISSVMESSALFPFAKIFMKWTSPVDLHNVQQHKTSPAVAL